MDFANLFSVILLLVAAGLTVLAGLPLLRRWQRERDGGRRADADDDLARDVSAGYEADVAMEERGHPTRPDQHRLVDHHPHDDQDEQMRNRPADEQHPRHPYLGGSPRQRPAEEPDPRHAAAAAANGHVYGGFDDDPPADDLNGAQGYEAAGEADEARRAAHFDWKVAAQYERARAARNASMSSFEPPPLPNDGPGTFTEEIPAIHAADGQRRHPAVHPDPDAPARQPMGQRPAGPPPFDDPWGSEAAVQTPPAFEFDERRYEAYEEHAPEPPAYEPAQAPPYGGFGSEPVEAEELAPPPHMRWQPDPEPDVDGGQPGSRPEEPVYGRPPAPGPRQAFAATTFRVQPGAEEPVQVHVAEPTLPPDQHGGYAPPAPPPAGYPGPGTPPDEQRPLDDWAGEGTASYPGSQPAHGFAGGYAPTVPGPTPGYEPHHFEEPSFEEPSRPPVFDSPMGPDTGEPAPPFGRVSPPAAEAPMPSPRPPFPDLSPLLADDEVAELRQRWNQIKGTFPDDPVTSVKEASNLVGECTKLFERRLGVDPDSEEVSTEDLRLALQRYLAFFERLLFS